jgi:Mlc titration factor MtfA (ptsG expression regulator)
MVWTSVLGAAVAAGAVFLFLGYPLELGVVALAPALAVGAAVFVLLTRRYFRRRRLAREPFPAAWRERLESCVAFYRRLDDAGKRRFERDVRFFMAEQRIYGERGAAVPDDAKLLVAASAAMLGHGMPTWEWPSVRDIVVYPGSFNEDYETSGHDRPITGMVHHQGPILFSGPELVHAFCTERDGANVGLHEMAHVMDFTDGRADGVPAGAEWVATAPWIEVVADRLRRVRRGQLRQVLRSYGGKNEAELFAVAVEAFFERPDTLATRDPQLFEMLAEYFNLDPRTGALRRPA